jgi:hypothetical protein
MDDGLTRAERRASSRSRSRTGLVIGAAVLVIAAVVVGAVLMTSGGSSGDHAASGTPASSAVATTKVTLAAGDVTAESAGPPVTVAPQQSAGVIGVLGDYVQTAIVKPLRTAQPAGDLTAVFDTQALARATGVDRAALVDEGIPKVTGALTVDAKPVTMTGLGDQNGQLVAIAATVDLDVSAAPVGKAAPLHIVRGGSFVFTPDASGVWKVSAYTVLVTRDGGGIETPTTTSAATSPTTPR